VITPTAMTFSRDERLSTRHDLVNVTVPRGSSRADAAELRDALAKLWPARDVRIFEAPDLTQQRLA
jgi:hypothetical protein